MLPCALHGAARGLIALPQPLQQGVRRAVHKAQMLPPDRGLLNLAGGGLSAPGPDKAFVKSAWVG